MKKYLYILFTLIVLFSSTFVSAIDIDIKSDKAIVYNLNDDNIIYEKNSNDETKIASLTKVMTAIVSIENIKNLDDKVKVKYSDLTGLVGYSKAGFKTGDEVNYKDLLYGLMLPSGGDAAQILANNIAGSVDKFVLLMNKKVNDLKLKHTKFSNPIGMDEDNYSTAADMAIILKYAIKNETFKQVFGTNEYVTSNGLKLSKTTYKTALMYNLDISNINGSKTGYTDIADYCLATVATINDVNYLVVTLNAKKVPKHIEDTLLLYNYFSTNYSYLPILNKNQKLITLKVKYGKIKKYDIKADKTIKKYLRNDINLKSIKYKYKGVDTLNRKIKKGDYLGKVTIFYEGSTLDVYKVYLDADIEYINFYLIGGIIISVLLVLIIIIKRLKRKRRRKKRKISRR